MQTLKEFQVERAILFKFFNLHIEFTSGSFVRSFWLCFFVCLSSPYVCLALIKKFNLNYKIKAFGVVLFWLNQALYYFGGMNIMVALETSLKFLRFVEFSSWLVFIVLFLHEYSRFLCVQKHIIRASFWTFLFVVFRSTEFVFYSIF